MILHGDKTININMNARVEALKIDISFNSAREILAFNSTICSKNVGRLLQCLKPNEDEQKKQGAVTVPVNFTE